MKIIPANKVVLNIATIWNIFRDVAERKGVSEIYITKDADGEEVIHDSLSDEMAEVADAATKQGLLGKKPGLIKRFIQFALQPTKFQRIFRTRKKDCQGFLMSLINAAVCDFLYENPGKDPFKYADDGSLLDSDRFTLENTKKMNDSFDYMDSMSVDVEGNKKELEIKRNVALTNDNIICNSEIGIFDGQHRMRWLELFLNNQISVQDTEFFGQTIEHFADSLSRMPFWKHFLGLTFDIMMYDTDDDVVCAEKFVEINNGCKGVSARERFFAVFACFNSVQIAKRLYSDPEYAKDNYGKNHIETLRTLLCKTPLDTLYKAFLYYTGMVDGYSNDYETVNETVNGSAVEQEQRFWKVFHDCSEEEFFGHMNSFINLFGIIGEYDDVANACHQKGHLTNAVVKKVYEQCVSKVSKNNRFGFKSLPDNYETIARKYLDKNHKKFADVLSYKFNVDENLVSGTYKDFNITNTIYNVL